MVILFVEGIFVDQVFELFGCVCLRFLQIELVVVVGGFLSRLGVGLFGVLILIVFQYLYIVVGFEV